MIQVPNRFPCIISGKMSWLLVCIFSLVQACIAEEHSIKSKYISTNLDAKWEQTPLIHEVAEYLSEENNEYFWDFVDQIGIPSQ